jgi:hypothetical protein
MLVHYILILGLKIITSDWKTSKKYLIGPLLIGGLPTWVFFNCNNPLILIKLGIDAPIKDNFLSEAGLFFLYPHIYQSIIWVILAIFIDNLVY